MYKRHWKQKYEDIKLKSVRWKYFWTHVLEVYLACNSGLCTFRLLALILKFIFLVMDGKIGKTHWGFYKGSIPPPNVLHTPSKKISNFSILRGDPFGFYRFKNVRTDNRKLLNGVLSGNKFGAYMEQQII